MEDSKDENIVQNEDKDVAKPELEDTIDVKTNEVTEEPPEVDLDKNIEEDIGETQEESEEEESQGTETEPSTQPMTNRSEDEDKRVEVGIKWPQFSCLKATFYRRTLKVF